jgi:hypothetical protein
VKVDTVPTGNMNYAQENMFLGQLPKRLVIACVDSDALNGTIANSGAQLYLSHIQSHFLNLDVIIGRVCHESKSVPTSSQFNFQIYVVE